MNLGVGGSSLSVRADQQPLGMAQHLFFVIARGNVNRRIDSDFPAGLQLSAQKVEVQMGVHFIGCAGVIGPTVMAFGKYRDGIHMPEFQAFLKLFLGKSRTNARDFFRSMEVQMNLTVAHGGSSSNDGQVAKTVVLRNLKFRVKGIIYQFALHGNKGLWGNLDFSIIR